jgi:hypothetical protein
MAGYITLPRSLAGARPAACAVTLGPSAWGGQGDDDEDCVFRAVPRRWTYAARVDLSLSLKIAATAQSFLSKWLVLPPVSRLWDFLRGVDARWKDVLHVRVFEHPHCAPIEI